MSSTLLDNVIQLLNLGVGDRGRLEHIKSSLEENKTLYSSDKEYVEKMIEQHIMNQEIESEQAKDSSIDVSVNVVYCSKCGNKITDDSSFCKNCGTKIKNETENKFCGKCGKPISSGRYCTHCGSNTSGIISESTQRIGRPVEWKSESVTLLLSILLGLFGIQGVGHMYVGKIGKGIAILIGSIILIVFALVSMMSIIGIALGAILLIVYFIVFIWQIIDSRKLCQEYNEYMEKNNKAPW